MQVVKTSNPEFYLLVDHFPYTESINKLRTEFISWFNFKKQRNIDIKNYYLDSDEHNTLLFSFKHRLNSGNFSFLYYNQDCLCFAGLQIRGSSAWIHRLFTNPFLYIRHLGTISQYLLPFQITIAKQHQCHYYKLTYTDENKKFYEFYRNKKYYKSKFYKNDKLSGVENISKFEFVGEQEINQTKQLVAQLDLRRPDIEDFCKF